MEKSGALQPKDRGSIFYESESQTAENATKANEATEAPEPAKAATEQQHQQ